MLATLLLLSAAAAATRLEIPFIQGWRWHHGDAPNGPEYGSGRLEHFKLVKHCKNMRVNLEWIPGGDKSAGQPFIVCGKRLREMHMQLFPDLLIKSQTFFFFFFF
jgi:hypothetical protein